MNLSQPFYIERRTMGGAHLDLNGSWDFCYTDNPVDEPHGLDFDYTAQIPSSTYFNVHTAGILPNPYVALNSHKYRFVDKKIWYYRRAFSLQEYISLGKAFICFEGVGYFSRVWINGKLIGEHEGLFGGPIAQVDEYLNYGGENELIVEVKSCNYSIPDEEWKYIYRSREKKYIVPWNMIKDTHTSNGDFTVMGIYRDVRIEFLSPLHLSRPHLYTKEIDKDSAVLAFSSEIATEHIDELKVPMNDTKGDGYVYGYVNGINAIPSDLSVDIAIELVEKNTGAVAFSNTYTYTLYDYDKLGLKEKYHECQFFETEIKLNAPQLWYPVGLGEQNLYTVNITLYHNGKSLDFHTFDFGVRTYSLEQTAGRRMRTRWGKFQSVVNGKRFFLKGMNWLPLDATLNISDQDYRWALELARKENIQMLRVWGAGNAPESDYFYKLCDELGIMVWQDGFISNHSNPYWDKTLFGAQQAMYIYRLRNHPSLVIHCSGNENNPYADENNCVWVWQHLVEDLDPSRERVRTTPDKGGAHIYNGFEPTWFRRMYNQLPFIGESGVHTFPSVKAMRQYTSAEEFARTVQDYANTDTTDATHPELKNRTTAHGDPATHPLITRKRASMISHIIDIKNTTLPELCDASGMAAYEYYQFMVQAMREQYPVTGGVMPWAYKRPWTMVSVQMLDGIGEPIAPYYAVKNAYTETEIHLALNYLVYAVGETVEIDARIINESGRDRHITAVTEIYSPSLSLVSKKTVELTVAGDCYQTVLPKDSFVIPKDFRDKYFMLRVAAYESGNMISQSLYWPAAREEMEDHAYSAALRADKKHVPILQNGPWLKPQIASLKNKAQINLKVQSVCRNTDRITGEFVIENNSDIPAFPVKLTVLNDELVQWLDDDCFFMEAHSCRTIPFILRNDKELVKDITVEYGAWNSQTKTITINKVM